MYPPYPLQKNTVFSKFFNKIWLNYLCIVDPYIGWLIPSILTSFKVIKKNKIKTVIVTGPPFSPVLIALIQKFLFKIKLIIDYRDPWSSHNWSVKNKYGNTLHLSIQSVF